MATQGEALARQNSLSRIGGRRSLRVCLDPDSYRDSLVTFFFSRKRK